MSDTEEKPKVTEAETANQPAAAEKQAASEKVAKANEGLDQQKKPNDGVAKQLSVTAVVGIAVACVAVGLLVGRFVLGGAAGASIGKTTLNESELDTAVATVSYNGSNASVTARDVYNNQSGVNSAKQDDGTYKTPSASGAVSAAQSKILKMEAESRGITVSDEDLTTYAEKTTGQSDLSALASSYNLDEDTVKELITRAAMTSKLRDQVVTADAGEQPTAPTAPASGQEATATADYAKYIIGLAGDEWDASANDGKGAWKASDSAYATALSDYTVANDSATYEAAQAAYYVAYQKYSTAQSEITKQWTDFANGLFSKASITINNLVV